MSSNTTLKAKMISISGTHLYLTQSLPFHKLPITIKKKKKKALIISKILKIFKIIIISLFRVSYFSGLSPNITPLKARALGTEFWSANSTKANRVG